MVAETPILFPLPCKSIGKCHRSRRLHSNTVAIDLDGCNNDAAATDELNKLFRQQHPNPLSAASTRGPTPSPDDSRPPSSSFGRLTPGDNAKYQTPPPLFRRRGTPVDDDRFPTPPPPPLTEIDDDNIDPTSAKGMMARKIFVGGVPQAFDQAHMYEFFGQIGKVKKAWLQKEHPDFRENMPPVRKHRGFGFVLFAERRSIDILLGSEFSKFISIGEGVVMEVKRAMGRISSPSMMMEPKQRWNISPSESPSALQQIPRQASPCVSWQACPDSSWQATSDIAVSPCVPPFPSIEPMRRQWSCDDADVTMSPLWQFIPEQTHYILPKELLEGKSSEVESLLLQALPDHYDD